MKAKMMSVKNWFVGKKKFFIDVTKYCITWFITGVWIGCAICGAFVIIKALVTGKVWILVNKDK